MVVDLSALLLAAKKVEKKWGVEYWLENTDQYCTKILQLEGGYQCSYHMHPRKKETFSVITGHVRLERDGFVHYLSPGDKLRIEPGTYHRFSSSEGALILESSSFHDDADVVRREESRKT